MRRAHRRRARHDLAGLAVALCEAYLTGELRAVAAVLGPGARLIVDTGGSPAVEGVPGESFGLDAVTSLSHVLGDADRLALDVCSVNGAPGMRARRDGDIIAVVALAGRIGAASHVWVMANPEKLGDWR